MVVSQLRKCIAPQGDTFARKLTVLRRKATLLGGKATLFGPKVTLSGFFAQDSVRCVNPSAEAERLGGKAGMRLPSTFARTTMRP